MHTLKYAQRVWNRETWEERAHHFIGKIADLIGPDAADKWLDERFPDGTQATWRDFSIAAEMEYNRLGKLIDQMQAVDAADQERTLSDARYAGAW